MCEQGCPLCFLLSLPTAYSVSLPVSIPPPHTHTELRCFWGGPSQFLSCPEKSILGGGLQDLSQEYYRTSLHSDKPPVTSSRDGAGQAYALHPRGVGASALAAGKSAIKGKMWITSLLVWAISNFRAPELWLGSCADSHTPTLSGRENVQQKQFMMIKSFVIHSRDLLLWFFFFGVGWGLFVIGCVSQCSRTVAYWPVNSQLKASLTHSPACSLTQMD